MNLDQASWLLYLVEKLSIIYGARPESSKFNDVLYNDVILTYAWPKLGMSVYTSIYTEQVQFAFIAKRDQLADHLTISSANMNLTDDLIHVNFDVGTGVDSAWLMGNLGIKLGSRKVKLDEILDVAKLLNKWTDKKSKTASG